MEEKKLCECYSYCTGQNGYNFCPKCGRDLNKISKAFEIIKQAMIDDNPSEPGSYAHSWHCNIAMMCHDAVITHTDIMGEMALKIGNDAASRVMKLCFDVETHG